MLEYGHLNVPDHPIIPFIEGDGVGPEITAAMIKIVDAAVEKAYGEERKIQWMEIYAGEKANAKSMAKTPGFRMRPSMRSMNTASPSKARSLHPSVADAAA